MDIPRPGLVLILMTALAVGIPAVEPAHAEPDPATRAVQRSMAVRLLVLGAVFAGASAAVIPNLAPDGEWRGRATFSAPTKQVGSFADEGDPFRLGFGAGQALAPGLDLTVDGVLSYIDVNDHEGSPGGEAYATGVEASLTRRFRHGGFGSYLELGLGAQNTFPISFVAPGTHFNFTVLSGAGLDLALTGTWRLCTGLRYLHMSNANTTTNNHGYDGISGVAWVERRF